MVNTDSSWHYVKTTLARTLVEIYKEWIIEPSAPQTILEPYHHHEASS